MRPYFMLASTLVTIGLCSMTTSVRAQTAPPARSPATVAPSTAQIRALGDAFVEVAEKVSPAVVQIEVSVAKPEATATRWIKQDAVARGMGSGVIFSSDGAILTNNHVIEEARAITVRFKDGRAFAARVVGRDPATDLAVLRVDAKNLAAASFADSDAARVGEWVVAIGSPFGLGHTVTTGVLSAKGRAGVGMNAIEDYLQTDASINPGNSGGPLVNLDGQVLGINTMIVSKGQGIGLAVPSNIARRVATQILKTGHVTRAWIGIGLQDLTPQLAAEIPNTPSSGALVNMVIADGPAARAHLEPGDVITKIGTRVVGDAQDIIRETFLHDVGEVLPMEVVRGGKRYQTKVTLEARKEAVPKALEVQKPTSRPAGLGLALRDVDAGNGKSIAQVAAISPDSPAARAGLKAGDVILEVDFTRLPSAADIRKAADDGRLLLRVRRDKATFYTVVR
ncbi:MAG: trypsin-like peptidase domain-containing protein [Polyangiaceae bacterium]|nr:trypsin-like peptidase domain-containing protein [Polyangiaceae bacterium]